MNCNNSFGAYRHLLIKKINGVITEPKINSKPNKIELSKSDIYSFVKAESDYYFEKWAGVKNPQIFAGWNWAAFFASIF